MLSKVDVRLDIQKFWEVEEAPGLNSSCEERLPVKKSEKECNDFYEKTTFRDESNRIVVKLPFNSSSKLGYSKGMAEKRFINLERKLMLILS